MKKTNNKGFSLVELIIVIAIMAILIGVLAPQYMRYVDKSRVANDRDLCDSVYNAMTAASADIENEKSRPSTANTWYKIDALTSAADSDTTRWSNDVLATLGVSAGTSIDDKLKSKSYKGADISYSIDSLGNFKIMVTSNGTSIVVPDNN